MPPSIAESWLASSLSIFGLESEVGVDVEREGVKPADNIQNITTSATSLNRTLTFFQEVPSSSGLGDSDLAEDRRDTQ